VLVSHSRARCLRDGEVREMQSYFQTLFVI
jgi:hypothetical protein